MNELSKEATICRVAKIVTPYLRLMLEEDDADRNRQAFLIAIARGRRWQQALDSGTVQDARQIGAMIGRDSSYVNRIIRLSMLAPQIIERVTGISWSDNNSLEVLSPRDSPDPLLATTSHEICVS